MDMFVIEGGRTLSGRIAVSGAKNAALPLMAAALAADGPIVLSGVPRLVDVETLSTLLRALGVRVERDVQGGLRLEVVDERPHVADYDLVRTMRATFCVLGPLLARRGRACVSLPGGCNIGDRPIDLHLRGLRALGAEIKVERGYVVARARRLKGAAISLAGPHGSTVTGTCNVMVAAALAEGITTIESAAREPEVGDLGSFLNAMGARIGGLGTSSLRIEGVRRLDGAEHRVIPDRVEAATLLIAAAAARGSVTLTGADPAQLSAVIDKLREMGARIETSQTEIRAEADGPLRAVDVTAAPYPGIPTDVQAQFTALLATVPGRSTVLDTVFPDRFMHAAELARLGANVCRQGNRVTVTGPGRLCGAAVMASDLRASAALVIAALAATGPTVVRRIYHLDRGYERLEAKLNALGAAIARVADRPPNMPPGLMIERAGGGSAGVLDSAHPLPTPKWLTRPSGAASPREGERPA
jgi:UDP-N-acetylglucosamine 1-carboxyvinyltransferase